MLIYTKEWTDPLARYIEAAAAAPAAAIARRFRRQLILDLIYITRGDSSFNVCFYAEGESEIISFERARPCDTLSWFIHFSRSLGDEKCYGVAVGLGSILIE